MTRARKRLYLLRSFRRRLFGAPTGNPPSRFLRDIPDELIEFAGSRARATGGGLGSQERRPSTATGAAEVAAAIEAGPAPFKAGDKVTHASFGHGIVVNCQPKQGDYEITVAFTGQSGIKRLLHSFAKLMKVEPKAS